MSDQQTFSAPTAKPRRGLKFPPAVALVLVLLAIAAGGWYVWKQTADLPPADLSEYRSNDDPNANRRPRNAQWFQPGAQVADGVNFRINGTGDVHIPTARARFTKTGGKFEANLAYTDNSFINADDRAAPMARFAAISDHDAAKKLNITDQQIDKLRAITTSFQMAASDADRANLVDLWSKRAASAPDKQKAADDALIEALKRVANDSKAPTAAAAKSRADQVRAVITQDQINTLAARRGG